MRLLILATLAATTVFTTPCMAEDPEFRLNYSANRGEILVLTAAGTIKRSNYDVASIAEIHFNGDVNHDDSFWCKHTVDTIKIRIICSNSETRAASKVNYMAIWIKK